MKSEIEPPQEQSQIKEIEQPISGSGVNSLGRVPTWTGWEDSLEPVVKKPPIDQERARELFLAAQSAPRPPYFGSFHDRPA